MVNSSLDSGADSSSPSNIKAALPELAKNLSQLGNYSLLIVAQWKEIVRQKGLKICDLSLGDPQEPTPSFIREKLISSVMPSSSYPPAAGVLSLRVAASDWLKRRFELSVSPDQIVPTSGSKEAVFHFPALLQGPCRIAFPVPGYPVYESSIVLGGHVPVPVHLRPESAFALDPVLDIERDIEKNESSASLLPVQALWVCSPHNPTGTILSKGQMEKILLWARAKNVLILSDECYVDSYDPGSVRPGSFLELAAAEKFKGVVSFFSLSKRSGMTGYRSGFVTGDPVYIEALQKYRPHAGLAGPAFVQEAAAAAWADDAHVQERGKIYAEKRSAVLSFLDSKNWEYVRSESTFYVWAKLPEHFPQARVYLAELALITGIVCTPGDCFGDSPLVGHWFRIALVPELPQLKQALDLWAALP